MKHIKGVQLPSSIPASDDRSLEEENLFKRIQEYCSRMNEHQKCEKETHYVILDSMKEYKMKQGQQGKKERDEVYR